MNVLIVDDEPLARSRLRSLLQDMPDGLSPDSVQEAASATQAWQALQQPGVDLVLLDIHMPGLTGLDLARRLLSLPRRPAIVFVTAHPEHALQAFDLEAVDYLTKPVRSERLQQSLMRAFRQLKIPSDAQSIPVQERGRMLRIDLADVLYLKAELKYLTLRTVEGSHLLEGSLHDYEQKYPELFVRVHRNALVALNAIHALERGGDEADTESWVIRLRGIPDTLHVSRRQLQSLRQAMKLGQPAP